MNEVKDNDIKIDGLTEKEAKEFKALLSKFVASYSAKDAAVSDEEWLKNALLRLNPPGHKWLSYMQQ